MTQFFTCQSQNHHGVITVGGGHNSEEARRNHLLASLNPSVGGGCEETIETFGENDAD